MDKMPVDFFRSVILLANLPVSELVFFNVRLIDLDKRVIPFLLVHSVDNHEYFEAKLIMDALLLLQDSLGIGIFFLHRLIYCLQLLYFLFQLEHFLLLLLELFIEFEQFRFQIIDQRLFGLKLFSDLSGAETEDILCLFQSPDLMAEFTYDLILLLDHRSLEPNFFFQQFYAIRVLF